MDEPLSSLDAKLRAELRLELKRIQVEFGATILYVTHDQIEAMTMASRIGVIKDGACCSSARRGRFTRTPDDRYVASRLGTPADQFPSGRAHPRARDAARRRKRSASAPSICGSPGANGGGIVGRVRRVEHLGDQNHVHLEYRGQTMVTLADPHQPLAAGEDVELLLVDPLYFDAAGRRITAAVH